LRRRNRRSASRRRLRRQRGTPFCCWGFRSRAGIGVNLHIDFSAELFQGGFELGDILGSDAPILAAEQAEDGAWILLRLSGSVTKWP
jgi:hypothetical protein